MDGEPVRFDELRGDGFRPWDAEQVVGESGEWEEIPWAIRVHDNGKRIWVTPTKDDLLRDQALTQFVERSLEGWFDTGLIPECLIPSGVETDRLSRERGWTHWHHLFSLVNFCNWFDSKRSFDPGEKRGGASGGCLGARPDAELEFQTVHVESSSGQDGTNIRKLGPEPLV